MIINHMNSQQLQSAYGILCQDLNGDHGPFQLTYAEILADQRSTEHSHAEVEVFIILAGQGQLITPESCLDFTAGDVLYLEKNRPHQLANTARETLRLISIAAFTTPVTTHCLYAAPITPNGKMHLGHLSGPYLAADILHRYQQQQGEDTRFVTGVDANQSYVAQLAEQTQQAPDVIAQHYTLAFEQALAQAQIAPSVLLQPRADQHYQKLTQQLFAELLQAGWITEEKAEQPYCAQCDRHLYEAFIQGNCAQCQQPQVGQSCEHCGQVADVLAAVTDLRCSVCDSGLTLQTTSQYYFDLDCAREVLKSYVTVHQIFLLAGKSGQLTFKQDF